MKLIDGGRLLLRKWGNTLYFYRKRCGANLVCTSLYFTLCYQAYIGNNEVIKMGFAGSLAHGSVEVLFHFVDTVNIKTKATFIPKETGTSSTSRYSTSAMVKKIWATEGVYGFGRGIGAAVYGNYSSGLLYFTIYKYLKTTMPELGGFRPLIAAFLAELVAIMYQFPFDLIKCRLQAVNYNFKYSSWQHGFQKEFMNNGVRGLYTGLPPYLVTYSLFAAMQFSIYEYILKYFKSRMPLEDY